AVSTIEATVEAVDHETRMVTLKGPDGKSVTIEVQDHVKNFAQVEVGDVLSIDYIESIEIQVFAPGVVQPGTTAVVAAAKAKPGQKPGVVAVQEVAVATTIVAIDKDTQMVTLKGADGETKTVKARNPENLAKVKVGDNVLITYSAALGMSVDKKTAEK
ncbi:MAG: hypothetical protein J7J71_00685, partial [Deltaproteobacteria bacterium]|nr:hypothetical protein [Candidatus Tharpella sp.]